MTISNKYSLLIERTLPKVHYRDSFSERFLYDGKLSVDDMSKVIINVLPAWLERLFCETISSQYCTTFAKANGSSTKH